jgi:hypothetical protein
MSLNSSLAKAKEYHMKTETSFGVYPRRLKSGKSVFYYWAYQSNGKRMYRSTGTDTYEKAVRHCRNLLKSGKLVVEKKYTFSYYTAGFFLYDSCPYIKARLLHGKSYSKSWASAERNLLRSRIIPEFGDTDIREITESSIESWLFKLKQDGTGAKTLNHLITVLRIIFGYALKSRDIEENPMDHIERFAVKPAEKGILAREELNSLFAETSRPLWESRLHFILNLTAAMTGMRLGELLGLKFDMIQPGSITVAHSWNAMDELNPNSAQVKLPISSFSNNFLILWGISLRFHSPCILT